MSVNKGQPFSLKEGHIGIEPPSFPMHRTIIVIPNLMNLAKNGFIFSVQGLVHLSAEGGTVTDVGPGIFSYPQGHQMFYFVVGQGRFYTFL